MDLNGKINLLKEKEPMLIEGFEVVEFKNDFYAVENLNVSYFSNNDEIFEARTNDEWLYCSIKQIPAWCYFENNPDNDRTLGKLYNAFCIIDKREIAPVGWEVASIAWEVMHKVTPKKNGFRLFNGDFSKFQDTYFFWKLFKHDQVIGKDFTFLRELIKNQSSGYGGLNALTGHYRISPGTIERPYKNGPAIDLRPGVGHDKREFNLGDGYSIRLKKLK
jgi:hypothetical protein